MRKSLLLVLLPLVLAAAVYGGWRWWRDWRFQQSTDDAYVQSDISLISPKVEGYLKEVRVQDNEHVAAGQVLFVIDDSDFAAKVAQAQAAVASEEAMVATYASRRDFQVAMINQAAATVEASDAEVTRADLDRKRYVALVTSDVASRQRFETAEADARKAAAALLKAKAALEAEKQQIAVLEAQKREEEARLLQARATLRLARNDLDNTVIRAPVSGIAGNRAGQTGQYVKAGTQLLSLVPLPKVYVTANFK
jgi:membrane fusion protein (multidrug efflux system)